MSELSTNKTVTGDHTVGGEAVVNVNAATATITIPDGLPVGTTKKIRKISSSAGTITIARSGSEVFTRASLTSVTLTSDGDFWVLEKVSSTRWELVDGVERGSDFVKSPDGSVKLHGSIDSNTWTGYSDIFGASAGTIYRADITFTYSFTLASVESFSAISNGVSAVSAGFSTTALDLRIYYTLNSIERTAKINVFGRWYA